MKERPPKIVFPKDKQQKIFHEVVAYIKQHLPLDTTLYRARLFGSIAKGSFGKYQGKWKGREFSDVDVVFIVDDNFLAPKTWKVHFNKPKVKSYVVYNIAVVPVICEDEVVNVDLQYMIIPKSLAKTPEVIAFAESWGVPLKRFFSKNPFITLRL